MRIAVCDDNPGDRNRLTALIRLYCQRHNIQAQVEAFATGEALLAQMRRAPFAVAFLDIFLEEEHGVELAQQIRRQRYGCDLFFCTVSKDFALDGFQLNALHYLVKPVAYRDVEAAMNRCGLRLRQAAKTLLLSPKSGARVLIREILYVEALNKNCLVHTAAAVETTRKTIRQLEEELGAGAFLRCHRSYIVNLEHVQEYDQADFILRNGARVPIRQTGRSQIKQAFREYVAQAVAEQV